MNAPKNAIDAQDAHTPADTPVSAIPHPRWRIFGLVVVQIVLGWIGAYVAYSAGQNPTLIVAAFVGLMLSQVSLLGMWGSLGTSSWWRRVICVAVGIGYLVPVLGFGISDDGIDTIIVVVVVTSFVAIPLLIARFFRVAIRLDDSPVVAASHIQFSIRHLMILTFVIACLISIGKRVQPKLFQSEVGDVTILALAFGLVGILPVWFVLATKRPVTFAIGVVVVGAYAGYCLGWLQRDRDSFWMTTTATEALSVVVSLLIVRSWGYRLVRLPKQRPKEICRNENKALQSSSPVSPSSPLSQ